MPEDQELEPTGGVPGDPPPDGDQRGVPQRTVDRLEKKWRTKATEAEREAEELRAKLQQIEDQNKSEQERAMETAVKKAIEDRDKHWMGEIHQRDLHSALAMSAVKHGIHEDFIPSVRAKLGDDIAADGIDDAVKEIIAKNPHFIVGGNNSAPSQPGSPTAGRGETRSWTLDQINAWRLNHPGKNPEPAMLAEWNESIARMR